MNKIIRIIKKLFGDTPKREMEIANKVNAKNILIDNKSTEIEIKVVGTTFSNPSGEMRQKVLQELNYLQSKTHNNLKVTLKNYEYLGELAIGVHVNNRMIGNIPKDQIEEISNLLKTHVASRVVVIGGGSDGKGHRKYFGARLYLVSAYGLLKESA